ncbi:MAG: hypothetical protein HFG66_01050 [Hungatella sp.]|nr:hypothetical protein [Hungatella sp.]
MITDHLKELENQKKLEKSIVLWGIGRQTKEILAWFKQNGYRERILFIADNFKCTFHHQYEGIPVVDPEEIEKLERDSFIVILSINYAEDVWRQLGAYGVAEVYNLRNLQEKVVSYRCDIPYSFTNRSRGNRYLCYILAGYEPALWKDTIGRIEAFQDEAMDYCLVSSGKYDETLEKIAEKNEWSYLYTEKNQVCFVQNLVIELHPAAEYIMKMDEDIFIGKHFFRQMIENYHIIEQYGEYRIGFMVPVVPLNCCSYASYIRLIGKTKEYEKKFGRAYKSRFSAVFNVVETAEFLWDTMDTFDGMEERFLQHEGYEVLDCYYNIGCIMFSRSRWLMMGKWPEASGESGMGRDEAFICQDNVNKDLAIYEVKNVLAGHLAFGHQKEKMLKYYKENHEKFAINNLEDCAMKRHGGR